MTLEFEIYWKRITKANPAIAKSVSVRFTQEQLQAVLERAFIAGYSSARKREKYDLPEGFEALLGGKL